MTDNSIVTPPEVMSLAVRNFHKKAGQLALTALDDIPKDKRNITALTLGISEQTYREICGELQDFRLKLLEKAEKDKDADSVYQLNFQFFPVGGGKNERRSA